MSGEGRAPRADARRNRARVLASAEEVFSEQGVGASTEQVARRAGVGVGTVFRHFPTKEELLAAVLAERMRRLAEEADRAAESENPGAAFFALMTRMADVTSSKIDYTDALEAAGHDVNSVLEPARRALPMAIGRVLTRAQAAGAVRADLTPEELLVLMVGLAHSVRQAGADRPAAGRRAVEIVFDALRAH